MKNYWLSLFAVPLVPLFSTSVLADAEAEKYVEEALPLTYHTCQSVVEESNGDNAYIDTVVRSLVALSLYNREVDIGQYAKSDADKKALSEKFVAKMAEGCKEDPNALLAGVIDDAVGETLASK